MHGRTQLSDLLTKEGVDVCMAEALAAHGPVLLQLLGERLDAGQPVKALLNARAHRQPLSYKQVFLLCLGGLNEGVDEAKGVQLHVQRQFRSQTHLDHVEQVRRMVAALGGIKEAQALVPMGGKLSQQLQRSFKLLYLNVGGGKRQPLCEDVYVVGAGGVAPQLVGCEIVACKGREGLQRVGETRHVTGSHTCICI